VPREVEERVNLDHRHPFRAGGELDDLVSCLNVALLQDAEVETGAAVGDEQGWNARVVHSDPDPVTGHAGLGDLEDGGPDRIAVADADLVVAQPLDGEVLAELPEDQVASMELAFPVVIRVDLVDEHGALLAPVPGQVALTVAVDVELAHAARSGDRFLEHAGEDGLPTPGHVLRQADVDGHQDAHRMGTGLDWVGSPRSGAHARPPASRYRRSRVASNWRILSTFSSDIVSTVLRGRKRLIARPLCAKHLRYNRRQRRLTGSSERSLGSDDQLVARSG
jgi:hypothetical protein